MSNGTALATRPTRVTVKRKRRIVEEEAPKRFVDFHANATDFMCVMLAALGWGTAAIAAHTNLTEGQVSYRIGKSENGRRKGEPTQRMAYRQGKGEVARGIVQFVSAKQSPIKQGITTTLDKRGLYNPPSTGVLRHNPPRRKS